MRTALLVLAVTGSALAQVQMPLPAFASTYSDASGTRGFYFQTPIAFTITGLRVPDESNAGVQCVSVTVTPVAPPAYPATATGGQVFYANNVPSSQVIPCALSIAAGDYVGVLGACGTTTMKNSYGTGGFTSSVLGQPVTLYRYLTQTNLHLSGGNQPYSGITGTSSIARVEVYIVPSTGYALASSYGTGCGTPLPVSLTASARPVIGTTFNLVSGNLPAGTQVGAAMLSFTQFNPGLPLGPIGMTGCQQYTGLDASLLVLATGTTASLPIAIPSLPSLAGLHVFTQSASFSPGSNPLGVLASNGLDLLLDLL
jgi:hypothetical protein